MRINLLIVDDEPPQLATIRKAAKEAGFQEQAIAIAGTAAEAEAKLESESFQLAVVDLCLTRARTELEDGLQLIQKIRQYQPDCRIIGLSTKVDTEAGVRAMVAGADDFISSKWLYVNWMELLVQRLRLWRGAIEGRSKALAHT